MKYEELIKELCEVVKETENNAGLIYSNCEYLQNLINESDLPIQQKEKSNEKIIEIFGLLQHQDLHKQKIERVVNYVCEKNNIDKTQYNLAPIAKNIGKCEDSMSDAELEELIKQMQN